jgi:hypothetical protein
MFRKALNVVQSAYSLAIVAVFGLVGLASAQTPTPQEEAIDAAKTQVTELANLAATNSASMLTTVASYGIVLLIVGAAIAFLWKFFTAGRSRC